MFFSQYFIKELLKDISSLLVLFDSVFTYFWNIVKVMLLILYIPI